MQIIPTTGLQSNIELVEQRVNRVKNYSHWIQVDVCDGKFAKGKTFELELLNKLAFNTDYILWDIHLMVKDPLKWIEKCLFVGASRIVGQVEIMDDRKLFVDKVKSEGLEVGLAFDVETEIEEIPDNTDEILIMGRMAGREKRDLDLRVYHRIEKSLKYGKIIAVDGGVNLKNVELLEMAGANIVYSEENYFELINEK